MAGKPRTDRSKVASVLVAFRVTPEEAETLRKLVEHAKMRQRRGDFGNSGRKYRMTTARLIRMWIVKKGRDLPGSGTQQE